MTILIEPGSKGSIGVKTVSDNGNVHRRVVLPGKIVSGVWMSTDLTGEPQEVQDAAAAAWTPEVIAVSRAQAEQDHANIPQPTPDTSIHKAFFRAALADMNKINAVDNAAAAAGKIRKELWAAATNIDITDPDVIAIATALNIDLDAVFARALEIQAGARG